jgi:hypothetical protein
MVSRELEWSLNSRGTFLNSHTLQMAGQGVFIAPVPNQAIGGESAAFCGAPDLSGAYHRTTAVVPCRHAV